MTAIELHIPDDLAQMVQIVGAGAESYIIDLLRSKVKDINRRSLADEYRMAGIENAGLTSEFAHVDLEGWDNEY